MASSLPESWASMNMDVDDSNMSNALLMSLWEETQADQEHDEERLSSLIRALEEELDPTTSTTDGHHEMFMDTNNPEFGSSISADNFQQWDVGYVNEDDIDCSSASGFGWVDMEMGSSSEGNEPIDNWFINSCDFDEIDCMSSNFGGPQTAPFEEHHGHQNVWQQETCNTRMLV